MKNILLYAVSSFVKWMRFLKLNKYKKYIRDIGYLINILIEEPFLFDILFKIKYIKNL